ncbi:MAG TPA: PqqD family protein [Longimicrobium sp.]|nr:PqqD family protein [Longimicrobium sp.]
MLLDPAGGAYFGLNEVGARIWALLPEHPTPAQLGARLFDEFSAPAETLAGDAARLLAELAELKLVTRG